MSEFKLKKSLSKWPEDIRDWGGGGVKCDCDCVQYKVVIFHHNELLNPLFFAILLQHSQIILYSITDAAFASFVETTKGTTYPRTKSHRIPSVKRGTRRSNWTSSSSIISRKKRSRATLTG